MFSFSEQAGEISEEIKQKVKKDFNRDGQDGQDKNRKHESLNLKSQI
jgi:hypothetical protein